jgi:hypothetical protein
MRYMSQGPYRGPSDASVLIETTKDRCQTSNFVEPVLIKVCSDECECWFYL